MELKKVPRVDFLRRLLTPLVSEWGVDAVRTTLTDLEALNDSREESQGLRFSKHDRPRREKVSAVSIAEKAILSREHKAPIVMLAQKFDRKEFLRGAGDIRHFFEMNNEFAPNFKRREDAFRKIMEILVEMPLDKIDRLVKVDMHGGPARLGPLSDAIRGVGETRIERKYVDVSPTAQGPRTTDEVPRIEEGTPHKDSSS